MLLVNEWETVLDLFMHEGFQGGLIAGLAVLSLLLLPSRAVRKRIPGWALGFAAAISLILSLQYQVDPLLLGSLGAVALAGLSVDLSHSIPGGPLAYVARAIAWALTAASIVWFTSVANTADETWIAIAFPLIVLFVGAAIWSFRFSPHADLLGPILTVTILGVWVTIPETDMFTIVVGAALPMGLATLPPTQARAIGLGAFALAATIAWLTIAGGETRPLSVIGGWATFGVLPIVPLLRILGLSVEKPLVVLGVHVAYAVLATRVVDIWDSIPVSLAIIGCLVFASAIALVVFGRGESEQQPVRDVEAPVS